MARNETKRLVFTRRRLECLREVGRYYDLKVDGLGLRIEAKSAGFFWWRTIPHAGRPGEPGKPYYRSLGPWPGDPEVSLDRARAMAEKFNAELLEWKRNGCPPPSPFGGNVLKTNIPTFRELVESYIQNQIPHTMNPVRAERDLRRDIANHFADWLDRPLDKISTNDVLAVKRGCGKHLHTANGCVEICRRLFNWSNTSSDGKVNFWKVPSPAGDVSFHVLRGEQRKRKRYLLPDELARFTRELEKDEHATLRDVLVLLLSTGARKSNVYGMQWQDVSLETRTWHIPMSKSGYDYTVNLTPVAMRVLERRSRSRESSSSELSRQFVFPSASSASGHIVNLKTPWKRFRDHSGLQNIRLHDLRRTCASYMAISGASMRQIQDALGHRDLASTEIYTQISQQSVADARVTAEKKMQQLMEKASKRLPPPVKK